MAPKLTPPPGYFGIGSRFILKRFIVALLAVILAAAALYAAALHPVIVRRWLEIQETPEFKLDSPYLAEYSGKARLLLPDGALLYEGEVEAAAAQGDGRLYDDGKLVYEGGFEKNEFSGFGRQYENGVLTYEGEFSQNLRSGRGKLFAQNGMLVYEGEFSSGEINGQGKMFENGTPVYDGGFQNGLYSGAGTEYKNSAVVYAGAFAEGKYSGTGRQYNANGELLYSGEFLAGLYDGNGQLYRNGAVLYEGGFSSGVYNGTGTEYDIETGYPLFSGKYLNGERMKAGIYYDENGEPISDKQPVPRPDPITLLGKSYADAVMTLTQAEIVLKEQPADESYFVIDEEAGVVYSFPLDDGGAPDYVYSIYYYGTLSAYGVVVGADISDIPGGAKSFETVGTEELLILGFANSRQGGDATAAALEAMLFGNAEHPVTAFFLPPVTTDGETEVDDESSEEPVVQKEPACRILFLRIDFNGK